MQVLDLCNNALSELPNEIGLLANLTELNISTNQISALPNSAILLRKLSVLDISNNLFARNFPPILAYMRSINVLHASGNLFTKNLESMTRDPQSLPQQIRASFAGDKKRHTFPLQMYVLGEEGCGKTTLITNLTISRFALGTSSSAPLLSRMKRRSLEPENEVAITPPLFQPHNKSERRKSLFVEPTQAAAALGKEHERPSSMTFPPISITQPSLSVRDWNISKVLPLDCSRSDSRLIVHRM